MVCPLFIEQMKTVEYEYIETANRAGIENCILKIVREKGHETDTSFHWHHGTEINYIISGAAVYTCEGKKISGLPSPFTR